jgi:hypothetical protein
MTFLYIGMGSKVLHLLRYNEEINPAKCIVVDKGFGDFGLLVEEICLLNRNFPIDNMSDDDILNYMLEWKYGPSLIGPADLYIRTVKNNVLQFNKSTLLNMIRRIF